MPVAFDDLPGHEALVGRLLPDGSLAAPGEDDPAPVAYRAMCTCGWTGDADHPPTTEGGYAANTDWVAHIRPLLAMAPPAWLLGRSHGLHADVAELAERWPLQAIAVLADVERRHKALLDTIVAAAREAGVSWADIGAALGITRQSAHQRFRAAVRGRAGE